MKWAYGVHDNYKILRDKLMNGKQCLSFPSALYLPSAVRSIQRARARSAKPVALLF
jgi:hypothetical protein